MSFRGPAFVLSNHITRPYCIVTSPASSPAGSEPAYLQTEEPSDTARILGLDPYFAKFRIDFLAGAAEIDMVALVNSNLSPVGYFRALSGPNEHTYLRTIAGTLGATTNLSGAVTDIDEVIATPGADYIGPTTTTLAWGGSLSDFGPVGTTPRTGRAMAVFVVIAKLFGAPVNAYPQIIFSIKESGTVIVGEESVSPRAVTDSTGIGEIFHIRFDPADLGAITFDDLQLVIEAFPGDNGSYCKIDAVGLYYEDAAEVFYFDTGWLPRPASTNSTDYDGPQPTVNLQAVLEETVTLDDPLSRVLVMFLDDQSDHAPVSAEYWGLETSAGVTTLLRAQSGYYEAGVGVLGPALFLETGIRYGSSGPSSSPHVEQFGGLTIGGRTYGADAFRHRTLSVELQVTREELDILKDRILWRRGRAGAFYAAFEPDIPSSRQIFNSGWWTVKDFGQETQLPMAYDGGDGTLLYTFLLVLEERT